MKNVILSVLVLANVIFVSSANANSSKFNHSGVKVGSIIENCYHNPCSGAKVVGFKKLSSSRDSAMLELTLVGYSRDWSGKKKIWNHESHKVYITCSIESPTVTIDGQVTTLPINKEGALPGILQSDYMFYVQACHKEYISEDKLAKKFGYNVQDW